jgi:hypothetical protein
MKEVKVEDAVNTPDGLPWLTADIPVRPDQFSGRIPSQFTMHLSFTGDLATGWQPVQAQLFRITPDKWKERIINYPLVNPSINSVVVSVPVPEDKYVLELYIERIPEDKKPTPDDDKDGSKTKAWLENLIDVRTKGLAVAMGNLQVSLDR